MGVIIVIIISAIASSNKQKKKAQKQKQSQCNQRQNTSPKKIPFSKDEWEAYLKEQAHQIKTPPAAKPISQAPSKPAPALHPEHDEPEGTVSTQGESAEEHARHRQKLLAEEQARREQHETLRQLQHMNTQKLRAAVVMSEVLGKPVSLRNRNHR